MNDDDAGGHAGGHQQADDDQQQRVAAIGLCCLSSQHFLYFLPLPHGQASLRPALCVVMAIPSTALILLPREPQVKPVRIGWRGRKAPSAAIRTARRQSAVRARRDRHDRAARLARSGACRSSASPSFLSGIIELADAWHSDSSRTHYSSGIFSVLAGALISFQSAFAFSGLMVATSLVLLLDGGTNVVRAVRRQERGAPRSGTSSTAPPTSCWRLIVWWLRDTIGVLGFGFFLGLRMAASGWQTLAAPAPRRRAMPFDGA